MEKTPSSVQFDFTSHMTSLRRLKSPAPAPALPLEDDDLLSEILLRLPP